MGRLIGAVGTRLEFRAGMCLLSNDYVTEILTVAFPIGIQIRIPRAVYRPATEDVVRNGAGGEVHDDHDLIVRPSSPPMKCEEFVGRIVSYYVAGHIRTGEAKAYAIQIATQVNHITVEVDDV